MATNLITLNNIHLAFGHHALLDGADFTVQTDERIGLIGRNGAGKSSLLRLIDGRSVPDDGDVMRSGGLRTATVEQEPSLDESLTVYDLLCADYAETEDWQRPSRASMWIDQLGLTADAPVAGLSGGMRKRVALANAVIDEPDLLLLDEPTNHLDFAGIAWLENLIKTTRCSVIIITHDRRFLDAVTTRIVELDRGQLFSFPGNYTDWQNRKADWLAAEQQQNARADKLLAQEEAWIRKGVQARRTRDEGRVRRLERLRRERSERRERQGNVTLAVAEGRRSGKLVAELDNITHGYDGRTLIRDFSTTLMRKDRIGLIGPNGSGKTTLLKIILGELKPDHGSVRLGTQLTVGYFDQMRAQLDENATLLETINPGSEWVEIGDQRKHVMSYLEDFLFSPARSKSPVKTLSGGERARLVLARMFARPTNVLVLDEPTNDLDIETLELLEDLLLDYAGTVLLVSHDREFLNNVVTQTIVAEGNGHWQEYVGGYDDWIAQRPDTASLESFETVDTGTVMSSDNGKKATGAGTTSGATSASAAVQATRTSTAETSHARPERAVRMTSWEQRELDGLPEKILALEKEQAAVAQRLADPDLYRDQPTEVETLNLKNHEIEEALTKLFERWEALEAKSKSAS